MRLKETLTILISLISYTAMGQPSMPLKKSITVQGNKICYYEQGQGNVILLLHGWPQTSYTWRKVIPILSKENRVVAIDLPGTGYSEPTLTYNTKSIANIINGVTFKLGIKAFHLVGHDVGAWVSATYALLYEEQLKTLTLVDAGIPGLIDPSLFVPENADKIWQFYFNQIETLPEELVKGNEKTYLSWFFTKKSFIKSAINKKDLKVYYKANKGMERLKNGFNYYRAFSESSEANIQLKKKLRIPVLAIGGSHAVGFGVGKSVESITTNLKSVSINNCGHYIPEEKPIELSRMILELVKQHNLR